MKNLTIKSSLHFYFQPDNYPAYRQIDKSVKINYTFGGKMNDLKKQTLKHVLNRSVREFGNNPALSMVNEEPFTYGELNQKIISLKKFMNSQGIIRGDRVAILSENNPNWGVAYFAITTMGAIVVPILPGFHENEIHHILRHAKCKAIFISEHLSDKIAEIKFETLSTIILIDDLRLIPLEITKDKLRQVIIDGSKEFAKIKELALRLTGIIPEEVQEDDVAAIIYTSGTTGHSKGVMLTHKNIVFNAVATLSIQNIGEKDRLISILPLSHTYECTLGFILPFMQGACVYYLSKPPTASVLLPAMKQIHPTMILSVPLIMEKIFKRKIKPVFMHNRLLKAVYKIPLFRKLLHKKAGKKLHASFGGKIHFFGIGGALLSAEVERFLLDARFPYAIGYGLTETSPLIAGCNPSNTKYRSTGTVLKGIQVKIDKKDSKSGIGEILVKGDSVMKGYYKDPERTKEVFTEDGWFKTGDLGILKKNNYLFIRGRIKNVIIGQSGENIFPEDIEAVINEHNFVLESIVYKRANKLVARIFLNYDE
ncbi:MAG: AMP-binding protein, partial [Candidatus Cloacimonadota bacterium]|nr:AMP-binding protein [Candidatus Cloacimonadota bacterium]